jgi:predicted membrane-bound spermidine synthase
MSDPVTLLGWLCYLGAAVAIVVYLIHFAGRQGWKRPWNAAGLFFTAIALSQVPSLFQEGLAGRTLVAAAAVTLCLLAATALQAVTAMRRRRRREDQPSSEAAA